MSARTDVLQRRDVPGLNTVGKNAVGAFAPYTSTRLRYR